MSTAFEDLDLTADQINSNYTWKQVNNNKVTVNNSIFFDPVTDKLITAARPNNAWDDGDSRLTQVGTDNRTADSDDVTQIGHNILTATSDSVINIGGDGPGTFQTLANASNTICIGFDNDVGNPLEPGSGINTIVLGNNNQIGTGLVGLGSNNIIIGHQSGLANNAFRNITIGHGLDLNTADLQDAIVISTRPLGAVKPVDGSIVFGGTNDAAADARIQFLSEELIDVGAPFNPVNPSNAALRIRYKGVNYKLPLYADP